MHSPSPETTPKTREDRRNSTGSEISPWSTEKQSQNLSITVRETGTETKDDLEADVVKTSEVVVSSTVAVQNKRKGCGHSHLPSQTPQQRSMSITFSESITRNGEIRQALHPISQPIIEEDTIEPFADGVQFSYPSYTSRQNSESLQGGIRKDSILPPRQGSIYQRQRPMTRNISFSTARRCSEFQPTRGGSVAVSVSSAWSYQSRIYQEEAKPVYDAENELVTVSRTLLKLQKYGLLALFVGLNTMLIWATFTHYSSIWLFILIVLSVNTFTQVMMALSIIVTVACQKLWRCIRRKKEQDETEPEKIVLLLPCYNETREEIRASVDSLVRQVKIERHPKVMMIIVDGKAKSPGEPISTQDFLLDEMLAGGERTVFTNGYIARDAQPMSVTVQEGVYQGVPYIVIGKARNQGKRDSLCFVRSFMWHYRNQSDEIPTMFDPDLFDYLGSILTDNGLDQVDYLTGMDGDTVFDDDCVYELVCAMRKAGPNIVGVCGAVLVKFDDKPQGIFNKLGFYFWTLIQNAEYMSTQGLRREFQSRITGKVNCLPGCCQLIRVSEATFGDEVLRINFGYVPKPNDLMTQQIMGVYSEDSLHASIIFSLFPKSQTAQALRARAYTTVPTSWKVYLSQRKRWALGSLCNESLMVFRRNILWIERISSVITVTTWWIGPFIYSSVIGFLIAIAHRGTHILDDRVFVGLLCVILFRYFYTFMIVTWFPHTWKSRGQFVMGFFMNLILSPLINILITIYSLIHSDEFSWGKTRMTADGSTGHGGTAQSVAVSGSVTEKFVLGDVEGQSSSFEEIEQHNVDKFSQRSSPFG